MQVISGTSANGNPAPSYWTLLNRNTFTNAFTFTGDIQFTQVHPPPPLPPPRPLRVISTAVCFDLFLLTKCAHVSICSKALLLFFLKKGVQDVVH